MLKVHLPNIVPVQRWYINDWDVLIRVNPIHLSYLTVVKSLFDLLGTTSRLLVLCDGIRQ